MERERKLEKIVAHLAENVMVAKKYAYQLGGLLDAIAPEKIGASYTEAILSEDYDSAVRILAAYYRAKPDFPIDRISARAAYDENTAKNALEGKFRVVNVDWEFPGCEVDYLYNPTVLKRPVNDEWLWQFNRHKEWSDMARAYRKTGDERYAKTFVSLLLRWINDTYVGKEWNVPGSAWRTIECGIRLLAHWPVAYDGFRNSPSVDDATLLLMIASMRLQTLHLVKNPTARNWLMMEACGTYTFSALFPELSDAEENRRIAEARLTEELYSQILPDGMHNELSPDYQLVVFNCATNFYEIAKAFGFAHAVSDEFVRLTKSTVDAAIRLSTPALCQPRTNDTYTIFTNRFTTRAEELFGNSPEYSFVNSGRKDGTPPSGESASELFPYAGFAVMRSDYGKDSAYMCFDVGPLGMAHCHQDKLNIILYKGEEELLYDDGGGQYDISPQREYALSGYAHNVALVDGLSQNRDTPLAVTEPISAGFITGKSFDYAVGVYDQGYGDSQAILAEHKREVRFCKPDLFVVTDTLRTLDGKPHDYELLFHLDTTRVKRISEYKNAVVSDFGKKYELVMIPLDEDGRAELKTVSAATEPMMQGWFNGRNAECLHEAITVSRCVNSAESYKFTTLLIPIESGSEMPRVSEYSDGSVVVEFSGKNHTFNKNALDS